MSKLHPFPFILFGSVLTLFISFLAYNSGGSTALYWSVCICSILVGIPTGRFWTMFPWQAGIIAGIPSLGFLIWRMATATDAGEATINTSVFSFVPMMSTPRGDRFAD